MSSWTPNTPSRTTIVKVSPPNTISPLLYIITVWMISQKMKIWQWEQIIIPIHHLQIPKIGCFSEPFFCKMAAAHLCWCMEPWWSEVHYFSSELYHACMASQVTEQKRRPISHQESPSKFQPPISMLWVLHEYIYIYNIYCHLRTVRVND